MKSKKLKLTSFTKQNMNEKLLNNVYGGAPQCGNTCDCTCSCDSGNVTQMNSNVNSAQVASRDTSFVSSVIEAFLTDPVNIIWK